MASSNLPQFPPSLFPQLLDHLVGTEIKRIDRAFRESLPACEYEHPEYGMCGRIAKVSDIDSERPLCGLHFHMIQVDESLDRQFIRADDGRRGVR
jgi:hypothetical protein